MVTQILRSLQPSAKRPTIVIFVGTTQSTTACRMAVMHTGIAACGSFESDGPNASLGISFLEFFDLDKLIRRDVLEDLSCSARGPCHFDGSDRCGLANTDMLHQR